MTLSRLNTLFWTPIDVLGAWIRQVFTPLRQVRLGVLMTVMGLVFTALVVVTNEPPLIFVMSALALLFGGIGTVITAVLAVNVDEASPNSGTDPSAES